LLYCNNRHSIWYYFVFTPLILISSIFLFYNSQVTDDVITIYGQENEKINISKVDEVTIPKGSANPSIDITNLEERKWYIPPKLEINSGNIVKWTNKDVESHTVTSGVGSGIMSLMSNELGKANGIFDSGLFGPGESWSYNFTNKRGLFTYFCTIHPWMTGSVQVSEQPFKHDGMLKNIPDFPVDGLGNNLSRFPVHTLTNDEKYDIDMGWSPRVLKTHNPATFLIDFFEMPSNRKSHLLPFDFVIIQNNKTLERTSNISSGGCYTSIYIF
jgi:plastocyanin